MERLSRKVKGLSVHKLASAAKQLGIFFKYIWMIAELATSVCLSLCLSAAAITPQETEKEQQF